MVTEYEQEAQLMPCTSGTDRFPALVDAYERRELLILKYSYGIPNEEAIEVIRPYAPILEVGAGNGYWAYELKRAHVEITETDADPPSKTWDDVEKLDALDAIELYQHQCKTLMLIWPTYEDSWPAQALQSWKGEYVIYVGEGMGGCTADDQFHKLLEKYWELIHTVNIPRWLMIHDRMMIYRRLGTVRGPQ